LRSRKVGYSRLPKPAFGLSGGLRTNAAAGAALRYRAPSEENEYWADGRELKNAFRQQFAKRMATASKAEWPENG